MLLFQDGISKFGSEIKSKTLPIALTKRTPALFEKLILVVHCTCLPIFYDIGQSVPKKIIKGFYTIYGHGGHLGHVFKIIWTNVCSSIYKKFDCDWQSGFWRENIWKCWWTTDGLDIEGQKWFLPLVHMHMYLDVLIVYTIFCIIDFNSFWVIHHFSIFPYKSI